MDKKVYKISEEQYARLTEDTALYSNGNEKPETVIKTSENNLSNAVSDAQKAHASAIEITDNVNESTITKKELIAEARKEWKNNTKVVKLSELLNK